MAVHKTRTKAEREELVRQMRCMRDEGKTYQEIAVQFNLSKQRIYQLIGENNNRFSYIKPERCIYKGIRKWMNDNNVSVSEMTRKIYGNYNPTSFTRVRNKLNGTSDIGKMYIDKILEITGLTYEVAFELESEV